MAMARLCSCMGTIATAWLTALPGPITGLSDMEVDVCARLMLGEALLPNLSDGDCPCGRSGKSGTHSPVCSSLWPRGSVVTTYSWRRGAASSRAVASLLRRNHT